MAALPNLISAEELAPQLNISYRSLLRWAQLGKIPHYRLEKQVRFDPEEIREWLKEKAGSKEILDE
jgi:excisionase family DNA binding protein